jgi:hypothetical protein
MSTWAEKITLLEDSGRSLASIARSIGLSVQSVCDLKHGRAAEPRGMAAVRLHAMAQRARRSRRAVKAAA